MNRIFKFYDLDYNAEFVSAKRIAFSSYPGMLSSWDDFYIFSSGMVMLQTTIAISNLTLYHYVHPQSLLAWQRVRLYFPHFSFTSTFL